jgi:hypothetical protein
MSRLESSGEGWEEWVSGVDLPAGEGSRVRGSGSVSLGSEMLARLTRTLL